MVGEWWVSCGGWGFFSVCAWGGDRRGLDGGGFGGGSIVEGRSGLLDLGGCDDSVCNTVRGGGGAIMEGRSVSFRSGGRDGIECNSLRNGGGSIVEGHFVSLDLKERDGSVCNTVPDGCSGSILEGRSVSLDLEGCDRSVCSTVWDGGGFIFEWHSVSLDSGDAGPYTHLTPPTILRC